MRYTVTGTIEGRTFTVTYEDGRITGDEPAVRLIEATARSLEGEPVGPVGGPYTDRDHLRDPLSALFVMREAFDEVVSATGDVPEAPDAPEDAAV